jgi:hypothetical protein
LSFEYLILNPQPPNPYVNSKNISGFCSAILNNAKAGPLGLRRPCSQSWIVRKLTPIIPAKVACDTLSFDRMTCGGAGLVFELPIRTRRLEIRARGKQAHHLLVLVGSV